MTKEDKVREIVRNTAVAKSVSQVVETHAAAALKDIPNGRESLRAAVEKHAPFLENGMAELYMKLYSDDEVDAWHAFLTSPEGASMNAKREFVMTAVLPLSEEWGELLTATLLESMEE